MTKKTTPAAKKAAAKAPSADAASLAASVDANVSLSALGLTAEQEALVRAKVSVLTRAGKSAAPDPGRASEEAEKAEKEVQAVQEAERAKEATKAALEAKEKAAKEALEAKEKAAKEALEAKERAEREALQAKDRAAAKEKATNDAEATRAFQERAVAEALVQAAAEAKVAQELAVKLAVQEALRKKAEEEQAKATTTQEAAESLRLAKEAEERVVKEKELQEAAQRALQEEAKEKAQREVAERIRQAKEFEARVAQEKQLQEAKEARREKELQAEKETQRLKELQARKDAEQEKADLAELDTQVQLELQELREQREKELQAAKEAEKEKELQAAKEAEKEKELQAAKEAEKEKELQAAKEAEKEKELQAAKEAEKEKELQATKEAEKEKELQAAKEAAKEKELQAAKEADRKKELQARALQEATQQVPRARPQRTLSTLVAAGSFEDTSLEGRVVQALVPADASAALSAKPSTKTLRPSGAGNSRGNKLKDIDEGLPVLPEEEQRQYRSWWTQYRVRSRSFESSDNESEVATPVKVPTSLVSSPATPTTPATPVPETPTTGVGEPPAGKSAGLLVGLVQQLQQGGGSAEQLVEALAKLVMDGQVTTDPKSPAEVASTPEASVSVPKAVVPGPTGPPLSMSSVPKAGVPSPPPAPLSSKSAENLAALESLPAVLPAAPPPKAPPLAVVTGISQQIETYNSSTHPKEYKSFRKFCTEDASAKELATAWAKGGTAKMGAFARYVRAGCDGLALEACMRFTRQSEDMNQDEGEYYLYSDIYAFMGQNQMKTDEFVARRRGELKGVSTCRNTGQETFLYFSREKRQLTTRSLDEISIELGVDPRAAADLSIVLQRGHNPCESKTPEIQMLPPPPPGGSGNNKQDASAKPGHNEPKNNEQPPKKKSRPPKPQGSELEIVIVENVQDFDIDTFVSNWVSACTASEGKATTLKIELESLQSQQRLMDLITDAVEGMAGCRKSLQALGKQPSVAAVQSILDKAGPFVQAYKKHTRVAQSLITSEKSAAQPKKKAKKGAAAPKGSADHDPSS